MKLNGEYENVENERFLNPEQWVHHTNYILPQGRAEWIDTTLKKGEEDEEVADVEPESGPELLRTVGSDEGTPNLTPWMIDRLRQTPSLENHTLLEIPFGKVLTSNDSVDKMARRKSDCL
jgi:Radial spokehead-like protein